jgi:hypothetical protein
MKATSKARGHRVLVKPKLRGLKTRNVKPRISQATLTSPPSIPEKNPEIIKARAPILKIPTIPPIIILNIRLVRIGFFSGISLSDMAPPGFLVSTRSHCLDLKDIPSDINSILMKI